MRGHDFEEVMFDKRQGYMWLGVPPDLAGDVFPSGRWLVGPDMQTYKQARAFHAWDTAIYRREKEEEWIVTEPLNRMLG